MTPDQVIEVMSRDVGTGIDAECFDAMRGVLPDSVLTPEKVEVPFAKLVPALSEDYVQAA